MEGGNMALDLVCVRRGICFAFKSILSFQFLYINILLLSHLPHVFMENNAYILQSENNTKISGKNQIWKVSNMPYEQLKPFQDLLEIMENLNMLNTGGSHMGCFYLEKVVRDVTFKDMSNPGIGIHFYFDEARISSDSSSSKNIQDKNIVSDDFNIANGYLKTGDCKSNPLLPDINGLDRLSRKQDDKDQNSTNDNTSNKNLTGSSGAKQMVEENTSQDDDRQRGLSRTQVIVIATCSAVIGTFFIIAGAMRITSCMKRYRANREAALVIARRTSAFGFGGSGNLRRDSVSSKASRQQSHPTSKNGSDIQIDRNGRSQPISHNSPQHSSDHNPLLPIHLVGQFSDGNSSHGSLAYIDEESHSRSKQHNNTSGSEFGSEDDPLLRKSPDSGSSVDICMEAGDNVNVKEEHMKLSSETLKDEEEAESKPERKEVFEPGGDNNPEINLNMPVDTPENETYNYTMNKNEISNPDDVKEQMNANYNTEHMHSTDDCTNENNDETKRPVLSEESELEKEVEHISTTTEDLIPERKDSFPRKQFSVDYFDVDDNGIEIQNPIFEEMDEAEPHAHLSENQVVTTGLTQSDSSLSNNPSYSYGNQAEYSYGGGYGQTGYFCHYLSNTDNNIKCLDSSFIHNSLRNSAFLAAETLRRENGELQRESFDESSFVDSSRKNSLIDDIDKAKYSRMYSTDSYFASPLNKTSSLERTNAACPDNSKETGTKSTDITTSTRKPHIIPLHEYHRNSLKGTIDEDDGV